MAAAGQRLTSLGAQSEIYPLPDAAFLLLRNLIAERTGVYFDEAKRALMADKLSELVGAQGLSSFVDYYYLLRYDERASAHWAQLMDKLSVPETYFWRQPDQFETLATIIAREHFAANPARPLRIWSAACCTGEEPVSIAIALAEAGLLGTKAIEIAATDGSPAVIARARAARYRSRSFRQMPADLQARYFTTLADGSARPNDALLACIRYDVANLADAADVTRHASADVIFCRNVFIYFSDDAIRETVRTFAREMPADGYLMLGASESLTRLGVDFELAEVGRSFVYVKPGRAALVERTKQLTVKRSAPSAAQGKP